MHTKSWILPLTLFLWSSSALADNLPKQQARSKTPAQASLTKDKDTKLPLSLQVAKAETPAPPALKVPVKRRSKWLDRLSIALPVQVNLIGLSGGLQPELLFRPISADSGLHLRAAIGFFGGQELLHLVPITLGMRWIWLRHMRFQPFLGFGFIWHSFLPFDAPAHHRIDMAIELGFRIAVAKGFSIGLNLSPEFGLASVSSLGFNRAFGLGMATRITVTKDLPW